MLCTIDVGNTCCKISLYDNLIRRDYARTETHGRGLREGILTFLNVHKANIDDVAVSCVVPSVWEEIEETIQTVLHIRPHLLSHEDDLGILLSTPNPEEIGSDLLAMSAYAYHRTHGAVLLISFGTATVFTFTDQNGEFRYAIISPGYRSFEKILWEKTDLLKESPLSYQSSVLADNTVSAISVGVVNAYVGMVRNLIQQFRSAINDDRIVVWACGGQGKKLVSHIPEIVRYEADLVSDGLAYLYKRRKK